MTDQPAPSEAGCDATPLGCPPEGMEAAPKDGRMLWLLVDYTAGDNPLTNAIRAWTIGFNQFDDNGIDRWQFAGWDWCQDCFTEGGGGAVIAWKPIGFDLDPSPKASPCE